MRNIFLFRSRQSADQVRATTPLPRAVLTGAEAIVTPNEVNEKHGIGIIIERFFGEDKNVLSLRSQNSFRAEQSFGARQLEISHAGLARWESYERMLHLLNGSTVRRVLCVPFFADDLITAICLKELFEAPLCIYVMDDNNVGAHGIPDHLFLEALQKARLRLGISPEIRDAYARKFRLPFHVLPPLVEESTLQRVVEMPDPQFLRDRIGVLIGNVWSQKWLERLRTALKASGLKVHWYGNTNATWLNYSAEQLAADGIQTMGFLPESELLTRLKKYPYAIIPSGSLDEHDDRPELARLSLPSRIPYLMGTTNLPLVVVGHPETAAAHFVRRFLIGGICPYDGSALREMVESLCGEEEQRLLRGNAVEDAPKLALAKPGRWIWDSLEKGAPVEDRFEELLPPGIAVEPVQASRKDSQL